MLYEQETYKIRGAIYEVYNEIGSGFLEAVYQECLESELTSRNIKHTPQAEIDIYYKGNKLRQKYKPDFICLEKIIVEIKAINQLTDNDQAQIMNYLKASGMRIGLLVNFGSYPKAEIRRIIYN